MPFKVTRPMIEAEVPRPEPPTPGTYVLGSAVSGTERVTGGIAESVEVSPMTTVVFLGGIVFVLATIRTGFVSIRGRKGAKELCVSEAGDVSTAGGIIAEASDASCASVSAL